MPPRTPLIAAAQGQRFACLRLNQHPASHNKTATCFSGRWLYFLLDTSTGSETLSITTELPPPSASAAYTDVGSIPTIITSVSNIATTPRSFLCFMVFEISFQKFLKINRPIHYYTNMIFCQVRDVKKWESDALHNPIVAYSIILSTRLKPQIFNEINMVDWKQKRTAAMPPFSHFRLQFYYAA